MFRLKFTQSQYAAIGHYVVLSTLIAVILLNQAPEVPWWLAFPLATMLMIATNALQPSQKTTSNPPRRRIAQRSECRRRR